MTAWIDMYEDYRRRSSWPDDGPYFRQPNLVVRVFAVIESQLVKEAKLDGKRS